MLTRDELKVRHAALKRQLARAGPHQRRLLREALHTITQVLGAEGARDDRRRG